MLINLFDISFITLMTFYVIRISILDSYLFNLIAFIFLQLLDVLIFSFSIIFSLVIYIYPTLY